MTEYQSALSEIKSEYQIDELRKIVDEGCKTGAATKHKQVDQTISFYENYEEEILEYLDDLYDKEFRTQIFNENNGDLQGYKNDMTWSFIESVAMDILDRYEHPEDFEDEEEDE